MYCSKDVYTVDVELHEQEKTHHEGFSSGRSGPTSSMGAAMLPKQGEQSTREFVWICVEPEIAE
jgi:hypothetical protein